MLTMSGLDDDALLVLLGDACRSTATVLAAVGPERFDDPSNLPEWSVRVVIGHILGATDFFGDVALYGASPNDRAWPEYADGEVTARFDELSARVCEAFAAPGTLEALLTLPTGPTPGSLSLFVAAGEIFVHGWDLARSTDQSTNLDPRVASELLRSPWAELSDTLRGEVGQPFRAAVGVSLGAPTADQLAGFLGRQP